MVALTGIEPVFKRSEEHTSELQSPCNLVCRLLLEKKNYRLQSRYREPLHRFPFRFCERGGDLRLRTFHQVLRVGCVELLAGNYLFFFFNDTATTEIYTLSYTTLFRSILGAMFAGIPGDRWGRRDSLRVMAILY